jgi:outer membrane lipoprotein-sorting protein
MRMVCLGVLLVVHVANAQSLPDAKTLLEHEATVLDGYSTYRYEEATDVSVSMSGTPVNLQLVMSVTGANPGKRRIVTKMSGVDLQLMVTDGKNMWMSMPMTNQYMHLTADAAQASAVSGELLANLAPMNGDAVVRTESVTVDGDAHDCWVLESRSDSLGFSGMQLRDVQMTFWIDKALGLTVRRAVKATMQAGGLLPASGEVRLNSVRRGLVFNEPVADSLFVFTPPPGATEIDGLAAIQGLTGGAAPVQPVSPPAPRRKSAVPSPGEPQAFVRQLHPITHIEAVWPPEAKQVQGSIDLLLTIDEQGSVTATEVLSGPQPLRAAAMATAKQMQFRPVIREGSPVVAYTTQTVDFIDWSKPLAASQIAIGEELAGAQREMALEHSWPRSKQQVLADFENDLNGAEPSLRQALLPQLAKAALDAGEIDAAERYAYDVLGSVNGIDALDGTAVHDSHLVLGRVAMTRKEINLAMVHLAEAGKTKGGPVLDSFGPDLTLAQQLLDAGEPAAVLEYLARCETFWKPGRTQLQKWAAAIRAGERPRLDTMTAMLSGMLPATTETPAASFTALPTR